MPALTTLIDGTVPVAADFNGNFTALNRVCGTGTSLTGYTKGDILYASAADTLSALAGGTLNQVLTMQASGVPGWAAGSGTLFDQLTGLTLSNNGADATNDIDISVGACASEDAAVANRAAISLAGALTKQLDAVWAVGTNQGMRASGAAIADTTYHIFAIMRPDTGVVDIAADTSATGANISANTNAAYTKLRRIGSIMREGGAIVAFDQFGDDFIRRAATLDVDATNPGTAAVTATSKAPIGVVIRLILNAFVANPTTSAILLHISSLVTTDAAASRTAAPLGQVGSDVAGGASSNAGQVKVWSNTSAQFRYRLSASGAADIVRVATIGWHDRRGKG